MIISATVLAFTHLNDIQRWTTGDIDRHRLRYLLDWQYKERFCMHVDAKYVITCEYTKRYHYAIKWSLFPMRVFRLCQAI